MRIATLFLLSSFTLYACAAEPISNEEITVTGWFNVVWGDPPPESGLPPRMFYSITDDQGQQIELIIDEALIHDSGGHRLLMGNRITITGNRIDKPKAVIKVISITQE